MVEISMPGYVQKAILRFKNLLSKRNRKQNSPHQWEEPMYGRKGPQYLDHEPMLDNLPKSATKIVQEVVETFLYYALAIDFNFLVTLGELAAQQTQPTEKTMSEVTWMLDYAAAHPDATITYHASKMMLWCDSDASYLSAPKARSRSGGFFFLSSKPLGNPPADPSLNGMILAHAKIIKNVMASAMEAEVAAIYTHAVEVVSIRNTLTELGHPQPPTSIKVDSQTAVGFAN